MNGKSIFNEEVRNGVDVPTDGTHTDLSRFADRSAATHERIEDCRIWDTDWLVEQFEKIDTSRCERADDNRTENGA